MPDQRSTLDQRDMPDQRGVGWNRVCSVKGVCQGYARSEVKVEIGYARYKSFDRDTSD